MGVARLVETLGEVEDSIKETQRRGLDEMVWVATDSKEDAAVARAKARAHAWDGVVAVRTRIYNALEPFCELLPDGVTRFVDKFLNDAISLGVAAVNFVIYQKRAIKSN